jgi:hypothetical protein
MLVDGFFDWKGWAAIESLATFAVAIYAIRQFREAREIANRTIGETRRIGEAQVRAYLTCESGSYVIQRLNDRENGLFIKASIRNFGQSPAINVRLKGFLDALQPADVKERGGMVALVGSIGASGQADAGFGFSREMVEGMKWELIFERSFPITFAATLEWVDVFGRTHSSLIELREGGLPPVPPRQRGQFAGGMFATNHIGTIGEG